MMLFSEELLMLIELFHPILAKYLVKIPLCLGLILKTSMNDGLGSNGFASISCVMFSRFVLLGVDVDCLYTKNGLYCSGLINFLINTFRVVLSAE